MYRTLLAEPPKYLAPLFVNRKSVTFAEGRWGCFLVAYSLVLVQSWLLASLLRRRSDPLHQSIRGGCGEPPPDTCSCNVRYMLLP